MVTARIIIPPLVTAGGGRGSYFTTIEGVAYKNTGYIELNNDDHGKVTIFFVIRLKFTIIKITTPYPKKRYHASTQRVLNLFLFLPF